LVNPAACNIPFIFFSPAFGPNAGPLSAREFGTHSKVDAA
jgi:hypothetical protein